MNEKLVQEMVERAFVCGYAKNYFPHNEAEIIKANRNLVHDLVQDAIKKVKEEGSKP